MSIRLVVLSLAALLLVSCTVSSPPATTGGPDVTPSATPTISATPSPGATAGATPLPPTPSASPGTTPSRTTASALACDYVPGNELAVMPPDIDTPDPTFDPVVPSPTDVPPATLQQQLDVFEALAEIVPERYIDPELNGVDWPALVGEYRAIVERGHSEEDLETVLNLMIDELGDDHSYVLSQTSVREFEQQLAGQADYVGVGIYVQPLASADRAVILTVFPNSPAERGGLLAHDAITTVDGEPIVGADGELEIDRVRGLPGTEVTLTIERPGQAPRDVTLRREPISGALPIRACLVSGTGVAYVNVPCLCDLTIPGQIRDALREMSAETTLTGVVLDNRINGGGDERVLREILALFVDDHVGAFDGVLGERQLEIDGEDVAGSQELPLVVLVGHGTASYGEVLSGVLQASDGALVMGTTTDGNVETLRGYELGHDWQLWLAGEAFESADSDYGPWEDTGIIPDVEVPTRWDLFTEANDPALAAAVEQLID